MEPINQNQEGINNSSVYVSSPHSKKIGLILTITPILFFLLILLTYTVISFIFADTLNSETILIIKMTRVVLGLIGILAVVAILICVPIGIVFMRKKEIASNANYDERSGKKENSVVPPEISKWNWGAAGLTWIWGIYHNVWISLLMFIPLVNIVMIFVLGNKGNEWAWKAQKWESVEKFLASQKKWETLGIIFFVLMMLSILSKIF